MKYKLIISDFDDTLNYDYTASQRLTKALKAFRAVGGMFAISTGRSFSAVKNYLPLYGMDKIDTPTMCCQGASTYSSLTGKVLFEQKLSNEQAIEWLKYAKELGVYVQMYIDDQMHIDYETEYTKIYTEVTRLDFLQVGDLIKFLQDTGHSPHKFVIVDQPHNIDRVQKLCSKKFLDMNFSISHPKLLEITSTMAGKGNMAVTVANSLGIDMSQVVCIGDSQNDISMLQLAGLSVAVGNARPDVINMVDVVTGTAKNDGVAALIELVVDDMV